MEKNKSKKLVFLLALVLVANLATAQESTNTSGGDATGSGGSVSYSVGACTSIPAMPACTSTSERAGTLCAALRINLFDSFDNVLKIKN